LKRSYVQISKKGNYGSFCNFQEHVNSQKVFLKICNVREISEIMETSESESSGNFANYCIFRSNEAFEISLISFFGNLDTAVEKIIKHFI